MDEFHIVRGMLLRAGRGQPATAPIARAIVEWAQPHADWLMGHPPIGDAELRWKDLFRGIAAERARDAARPQVLQLAEELASLLGLEPVDGALLVLMIACDRLPRAAGLLKILSRHGHDLPTLLGELAGAEPHDAERMVRRSPVLRLGLIGFAANRQGEVEIDVRWMLERLLDRAPASGAALHGIGEADEDGEEPTRWDRVHALQLAQRLLAPRGGAALLFDEMEDLIGGTERSSGDWFARREGSKVFVNRMLEANAVPVIWTTNAIGNIDDAILRRMSFVVKLDFPPRSTALRMLDRIARDEGVRPDDGFNRLIERAPETATVLRVAARAARLAEEADGGIRAASALVRALRGGELPLEGPGTLDLDLFETDRPVAPLFAALRDSEIPDVSLPLTGPPGTGKTALAHHLARTLDRPLIVKRASDLLSKWVGQTEARIADAFAEARQREGVLLFDEADSLLFDRATAHNSWEVGQVNELLTWLDRHPLPVVAVTNHAGRLDPAMLRRFVFKLELHPLGNAKATQAFGRFFGMAAPANLAELHNLTPGDFSVVARQLRHAPAADAMEIVNRLRLESMVKPERGGRIGF